MSGALLTTKLYVPMVRPDLMGRPRLTEELQTGGWRPFTLVSAPAGFGKTTLVSDWVRQADRPTAWVSLDTNDNEPSRFVSYITTALRGIHSDFGEQNLETPFVSSPAALESVLTDLVNQIASIPGDFTFVFDDYHVITNMEIHEFVSSLLDSMPPQMHLVMTTRADPPLPLSRLRARGLMTEIREADLRFTRDETHVFLSNITGTDLSRDEIDVLENRTEGWVAGLQMAALSMRGNDDVSGFVRAFAGDDRHIIDFLAEEVFERQTEDIQTFLLQTAVLSRLTGALCDAVTEGENGSEMLRTLEQANLFVVPLDDKRQWFRYHQLFADALRARMAAEQPDWERTAHGRASVWHESNGTIDEAITHAVATDDIERVADLYEVKGRDYVLGLHNSFFEVELLATLEMLRLLPESALRTRPHSAILYSWRLYYSGRLDDAKSFLLEAEANLGTPEEAGDERTLAAHAQIALQRTYIARAEGDLKSVLEFADQTLTLLPESSIIRSSVALNLARAYWLRGDVRSASQRAEEAFDPTHIANRHSAHSLVASDIGRIQIVQGRLRDAFNTMETSIDLAAASNTSGSAGFIDINIGMSEVLREWNRLEEATEFLVKAKDRSERIESPNTPYYPVYQLLALARLKQSQGDFDAAIEAIKQVEQLPVGETMAARIINPAAFKARLWLLSGRLNEALRWATDSGPGLNDDLEYQHEFEHVTQARVLIAQCAADSTGESLSSVLSLLDRLLVAAEADGRGGSVIELLVVQALAHQAMGSTSEALSSIGRALVMAEPEGYIRLFIDEGEPMRTLLRDSVAKGGNSATYARTLLEAFGEVTSASDVSPVSQDMNGLIEPLSMREIEIIRLITTGMTNQEIADHLFIALGTVKRHATHIYSKLGVDHRSQAIARAQELGLV